MNLNRLFSLSKLAIGIALSTGFSLAQHPTVDDLGIDDTGRFSVSATAQPDVYYRLLHAPDLSGPWTPSYVASPEPLLPFTLTDPVPAKRTGFYRLEQVATGTPKDSDGDGIDDLTELRQPLNGGLLNPLNPAQTISISDGAIVVTSRETFEMLARVDDVIGAIGIRELKFLIMDADTDRPELYFLNTNAHPFHHAFAHEVLGYPGGQNGLIMFNGETYWRDSGRKNIAGSLIAHDNYPLPNGSTGIYTMEFWPTDPVGFPFVETAYRILAHSMPFIETRLLYHPNGETQSNLYEQQRTLYEQSRIGTIQSEDLFGNLSYSPLNLGFSYGRLKVINVGTRLSARDIAIFKTIPNDLARVSGIITEIPQTPLSHINLKARQNNTPNAYIRDITTREDITPLIGQNVRFEVTGDGFSITPATQSEVDLFLEDSRPTEPQLPVRDLGVTGIGSLDTIRRSSHVNAYGSKSVNVAELKRILPEGMVPEGVAVPFFYYDTFMRENGFYQLISNLMAEPRFQEDDAYREARLATFRDQIEDAPVPLSILDTLGTVQSAFPPGTRIRCRSSANVEDLVGFNGAGLYDSKTHKPSEGHITNTFKQVWAGNWTFRAFEEREFYRIDHLSSAMGVLCHPSFRGEQANGVAVTRNLFNPGWVGYYINVQAGESLVTNPDEQAVPDEFLISAIGEFRQFELQYVRHSNLIPEGTTVLTKDQAVALTEELRKVQTHFKTLYNANGNDEFAMEIEFKITASGSLAIKQARPWVE